MSTAFIQQKPKSHKVPCITLVGMPGAGKSTVGLALAQHLNWGFVDTDCIIEATYGVPLQNIADAMSKEDFLEVEATVIASLRLFRVVIASGGSVVYRENAMQHLRSLGPVVHLCVDLPTIEERIARKPDRGLAIAPGQTILDLYEERQALYTRHAQCRINAEQLSPEECVHAIVHSLRSASLMP